MSLNPSNVAVAVLGSGGIVGAWRMWFLSNSQSESISVTTMRGVIEELRVEVNRLSQENRELREQVESLRRTIS